MTDSTNGPSPPAPVAPRSQSVRVPVMPAARIAASIVDGIAILVLGALAWKYAQFVPYLIGAILLVAGVRIGDIRNAMQGRGEGGGHGTLSAVLALFVGPWWHS